VATLNVAVMDILSDGEQLVAKDPSTVDHRSWS